MRRLWAWVTMPTAPAVGWMAAAGWAIMAMALFASKGLWVSAVFAALGVVQAAHQALVMLRRRPLTPP